MAKNWTTENLISKGFNLPDGNKPLTRASKARVAKEKGNGRHKKPEQALQKAICAFIRENYPDVYFFSDPSGIPTSSWGIRSLIKQTRSKHAALDIVVLHPSGGHNGLVLELKADTPYRKDGKFKTDQHLADQIKTVEHLNGRGYFTCFAWDIQQAKHIIINYLK